MPSRLEFIVSKQQAGCRLDRLVAEVSSEKGTAISRQQARALCERKRVYVDDVPRRAGYYAEQGQAVAVVLIEKSLDIPKLCSIYEDAAVFVLEKARGVHSTQQRLSEDASLEQSLLEYCKEEQSAQAALDEAGLVQRLDFWTSGLLLAAKTAEVQRTLRRLLKENAVRKSYIAVVEGLPSAGTKVITSAIDAAKRKKVRVVASDLEQQHEEGASATTTLRVVAYNNAAGYSLVVVTGQSMQRHQIRAHLASIGHPLVGDTLYGATERAQTEAGFYLHARSIVLPRNWPGRRRFTSDAWKSWPLVDDTLSSPTSDEIAQDV